ncbi:CPBP family intramembrane metalloprotease [Arenibacter sp. TNZ]|uniref:CPBP family intramembrane glutamic endopeptidase n=1 Tax=Arenibacter TaxID=178469 RepID=UPI000CD40AE8|nr:MULTISPECIES: CPBP family intramembrane glutamic endopeptidase [Arenibacter]MCM4174258.1 CPBP family intramembrane metalloprotease [Arenibacter sp. TNZ]
MYIEQGYKGNHESWRYLVGVVIIFIGWQLLGSIPLLGVIIVKSLGGESFPTDVPGMSRVVGSNLFLFLMLISFVFGLLATFLTVKFVHRQTIVSLTTSRNRIDWKRVFFAFGLWGLITILITGLDIYMSPEDYVFNFNAKPFIILCLISVFLIPLQTSFEEYFMRGYLMQGIGLMAGKRWVPLVITSMIFGLLHLFNPEVEKLGYGIMVYYIGTGFFLGILTLMDEGLELAIGFHAANNLLTALLVTADWTAFQTESLYRDISDPKLGWDVFVPVLVIYPILLFIFSKKYGWSNWKERLTGDVQSIETIQLMEENGSNL